MGRSGAGEGTGKWNTRRIRSQGEAHKNKRIAIKLCKVNRKTSSDRRRSQQQAQSREQGAGEEERSKMKVEQGACMEDGVAWHGGWDSDADGALVRVDCGVEGQGRAKRGSVDGAR